MFLPIALSILSPVIELPEAVPVAAASSFDLADHARDRGAEDGARWMLDQEMDWPADEPARFRWRGRKVKMRLPI